jgi:hypothetical protein
MLYLDLNRFAGFENLTLRRIFGTKKNEVIGSCRKLCNESSPNIIRMKKLRRVTWAGHVAYKGEGSVNRFGEKAKRHEATKNTYT